MTMYKLWSKCCIISFFQVYVMRVPFRKWMNIQLLIFIRVSPIHRKLRNTNLHDIIHSLISRNPRERMFVVQISLLIVTFLSLISLFFSLMQTTKKVNMWSVPFLLLLLLLFFFLCHLLNVGVAYGTLSKKAKCSGRHQRRWEGNEFKFHSATCYTNYVVSCIHVDTTKLCNITCTLVAIGVLLQSLECV